MPAWEFKPEPLGPIKGIYFIRVRLAGKNSDDERDGRFVT